MTILFVHKLRTSFVHKCLCTQKSYSRLDHIFNNSPDIFAVLSSVLFLVFVFVTKYYSKRNIYKVAMRNIQYNQSSLSEAYRAETELVKNIFLFIMNIVELLSITITVIPAIFQSLNERNDGTDVSLGNYSQENLNIY